MNFKYSNKGRNTSEEHERTVNTEIVSFQLLMINHTGFACSFMFSGSKSGVSLVDLNLKSAYSDHQTYKWSGGFTRKSTTFKPLTTRE